MLESSCKGAESSRCSVERYYHYSKTKSKHLMTQCVTRMLIKALIYKPGSWEGNELLVHSRQENIISNEINGIYGRQCEQ